MLGTLKDFFLIDQTVVFLNHGAYGACPAPVFETYQNWQLEMECQPVDFLGRLSTAMLKEARISLAEYVNADAEDLIFVPNTTTGINAVARSWQLQPGDEVLGTNHAYPSVDNTWGYVCQRSGAKYIRRPIALPLTTEEDFIEVFWQGVTAKTKVISISHITSPTSLTLPIKEICRRARESGIMTVIDGAHAPGHIPLNLNELGADFYTGNCHKWLCAPKGSAFLHVRKEHQEMLVPSVVSNWWGKDSTFTERHEWQGTRDISAFLSIPAAIEFQKRYNWDSVRKNCHTLAVETRQRIAELTGLTHIAPDSWFGQMITVQLPPCDIYALKDRLYDEFRIELPAVELDGQQYVRISFQGYNDQSDADALVEALEIILKDVTG